MIRLPIHPDRLRRRWRRLSKALAARATEFDLQRRRTRDVVVVSYPKSGRTWLRFMLGRMGIKLRFEHEGSENRYGRLLKDIASRPLNWSDWRVVVMVRDPRDTVVSSYFEATKRVKEWHRYDGTMSEFMRSPNFGLAKIAGYNLLWLEAGPTFRAFLPVTYEDLRRDAASELRRLVSFALGRPPSERAVCRAVEAGSFDNMRRVELSLAGRLSNRLRLGGGDPADPESMKTRKGKVGGWRDYFDGADVAYMDKVLADLRYWDRLRAVTGATGD